MANNSFEKNQKILYNSVPDQRLTQPNQLTIKQWNDIINILKVQANINADYLEKLHKWFIGNYDNTKTFEDNIISIPVDEVTFGEYTPSFAEYTLKKIKVISEQLEINRLHIANLKTQLGNIRNIGTITTLDDLNDYTTNGTYTFTYYGKECLMLVNDTMNYPVQMIVVSSAREERIIREYYNNKWTITLNDFVVYESDLDEAINRIINLENADITLKNYVDNELIKKADITYVDNKFNQLFGEGQVSQTLDTIAEISRALEENVDVVEKLDESITNKADKSYVDDLLYGLNIYDYVVTNNPEVKDDTLYLENGYVRDGTLYLKNAKVENGVLYIDYIE